VSSPDFVAQEGSVVRNFDVTAPGAMKKKLRFGAFPYEFILYSRPPGLVFPP
jgi:hypothetical protein